MASGYLILFLFISLIPFWPACLKSRRARKELIMSSYIHDYLFPLLFLSQNQ